VDPLSQIYAETDRLLAGWSCERSTDCCHFGRTGREPQLWANEWALLRKALRAHPAPRTRRLPLAEERRCPLLGDDDRCVAYAARPFGCRTFFCERATGPERRPPRAELNALGRRIAALAEPSGVDGPRALTAWLAAHPRST